MNDNIRLTLNRIGEMLWVKPLVMCIVAVGGAFLAQSVDYTGLEDIVPEVTEDSVNTLLSIISGSMLVIATFAVSSMVSAYASAGSTATPRSFALIIADDVSQNALSVFIGAFIFSIVSLIALENSYYGKAGRFTLFVLTLIVFALVILTFVRWVDRVARLGRMGTTIDKVEGATTEALTRRKIAPLFSAAPITERADDGEPVFAGSVGHIQFVSISKLNEVAMDAGLIVVVNAMPGTFVGPGKRLLSCFGTDNVSSEVKESLAGAFVIGDDRNFDDDPRFGLVVLSEIASRALSPGINDPGTAIDVIGTLVRIFTKYSNTNDESDEELAEYERVEVPRLDTKDLFTDSFRAIARDGAGTVEVVVRLQKAFEALSHLDDKAIQEEAKRQSRIALVRAEEKLTIKDDIDIARQAASFSINGD